MLVDYYIRIIKLPNSIHPNIVKKIQNVLQG